MEYSIGIKIAANQPIAKIAKIIRLYENLSISEIKKRIECNNYVLCYDYTDFKGLSTLLQCYEELNNYGICSQLYENDRACNVQLLLNLHTMYQQIHTDIETIINIEGEE